MEFFDVIDENGMPTGETVERAEAHRGAIPHRTSHVWIARRKGGTVQILLQKRCMTKDSFPGCYDISSAGHIPAGDDFIPSAIRELKEELGVEIAEEALVECGTRKISIDDEFYGVPFHDRQFSKVFLLWLDREAADFTVQKEEIDSVRWMDFEECKKAVEQHSIPNCIDMEELLMLEKKF
jgi:isopentenyldiphosphate isomerase